MQVALPDGSTRTYDDWHLPSYGEYTSLQNRGKYCPTHDSSVPVNSNDDYPDTGQATSGLPALGFQNVATELKAAPNDNGSNGDLWMSNYFYDSYTKTVDSVGQWEYRLNHGTSNTSDENNTDDKNAYLLCRTFGPSPVVSAYFDPGSESQPPDGVYPPTYGSTLTAGECSQYGVPTSISVSETTAPSAVAYPPAPGLSGNFTVPPGARQAVANITYLVNIGGSYTAGYQSTKTFSNPTLTQTGTVSTVTAGSGLPNQLAELVNWTSSAKIFNLPYLGGIEYGFNGASYTTTASLLGAGGSAVSGSFTGTAAVHSQRAYQYPDLTPQSNLWIESAAARRRFIPVLLHRVLFRRLNAKPGC